MNDPTQRDIVEHFRAAMATYRDATWAKGEERLHLLTACSHQLSALQSQLSAEAVATRERLRLNTDCDGDRS